jgi:hypothetical protein
MIYSQTAREAIQAIRDSYDWDISLMYPEPEEEETTCVENA